MNNKAAKIKLIICDVDGVLTDGSLNFFYTPEGKPVEIKKFHALDGVGIAALKNAGLKVAIITGGKSSATEITATELNFDYFYHSFFIKLPALEDLAKRTGLSYDEMCFVGDDIIDLPVLTRVGLAVAVKNSATDVLKSADYITASPGGAGAIRETAELILRAQNKWAAVLKNVMDNNFPFPHPGTTKISPEDL